mmetsp:Transcript_7169/g.27440  ORF Transcript_7169/g.27440 Transcript_7169/m.27440 type:complete len:376 (+) Transcript_7169:506-1633(+)
MLCLRRPRVLLPADQRIQDVQGLKLREVAQLEAVDRLVPRLPEEHWPTAKVSGEDVIVLPVVLLPHLAFTPHLLLALHLQVLLLVGDPVRREVPIPFVLPPIVPHPAVVFPFHHLGLVLVRLEHVPHIHHEDLPLDEGVGHAVVEGVVLVEREDQLFALLGRLALLELVDHVGHDLPSDGQEVVAEPSQVRDAGQLRGLFSRLQALLPLQVLSELVDEARRAILLAIAPCHGGGQGDPLQQLFVGGQQVGEKLLPRLWNVEFLHLERIREAVRHAVRELVDTGHVDDVVAIFSKLCHQCRQGTALPDASRAAQHHHFGTAVHQGLCMGYRRPPQQLSPTRKFKLLAHAAGKRLLHHALRYLHIGRRREAERRRGC